MVVRKKKKEWKQGLVSSAVRSLAGIAIDEAVSAPFAKAGKRFLESTEGLQMSTGINKYNSLTSQSNDYDTRVNRTGLGDEEFTRRALRDSVVNRVQAVHGDQWRTIAPWLPKQIDEIVEAELPRQLAERQALRDKFGGPTKTNAQIVKSIETVNPHATGPLEWAAKRIGRRMGSRDSIEKERQDAVKTIAHGFGLKDFSEGELNELTGLVMAGTSPIDVQWVRTNTEKLLGDKRLQQRLTQAEEIAALDLDRTQVTLELNQFANMSEEDGGMSASQRDEFSVVASNKANLTPEGLVRYSAWNNHQYNLATDVDMIGQTVAEQEAMQERVYSDESLRGLDEQITEQITNAYMKENFPEEKTLSYSALNPAQPGHAALKREIDDKISKFKMNVSRMANDVTVSQLGELYSMKDEKGNPFLPREFRNSATAPVYQYRLFVHNVKKLFTEGYVEEEQYEDPKGMIEGMIDSIMNVETTPLRTFSGIIKDPLQGLLGTDPEDNTKQTVTGGDLEVIMTGASSGDFDFAKAFGLKTPDPDSGFNPGGDGGTDDGPKDTRTTAERATAGEDVGEQRERKQVLVKTAQKKDSYKKKSPSEQYDWVADLEQEHRDAGSPFPFAPTTNESPFLEVGETEEFTIGADSLLTDERPSTFRMSYGSDGEIEIDQIGRLAAAPGTERNPTYDEIPEGNFKNQIRWISKDYFGITDDLINNHPDVPEELIHGKINPLRGEASAGAVLGSGSPARELKNIQQDLVGMFDIEGIFDYDDIVDLLTQAHDAERS